MYKNEFQLIDTKEKAYVLGLLFSDGFIGHYNNHWACAIVQHENEKYLLEKIIETFPFFKLNKSHMQAYKIQCNQKKLVEDLLNLGITYRKSTEGREELKMPVLNEKLISHFIRGYFDGDGSVTIKKLGNTCIEIGGTCFNLISSIQKILYDNRINVNMSCRYAGENLQTIDYYRIFTSSDKISKLFANYIYQDCEEFFMRRKYEKLYFIPEYNKKERLQCQVCNSFNTMYNGFRNGKTRIKCKDCKKMSSVTAPNSSNIIGGGDELLEG